MKILISDRLRRITSRHNALVKELRRAFSQGEPTPDGYCAIESVRVVEEAIRSGLRFRAVFFSESAEQRAERLLPQIGANVETLLLPDEVFRSAVATETPQGVAALVKLKHSDFGALLGPSSPLIMGVAGIQDPGNLGTIVRSAEAFGATAVLLGEKTVSPFNPKVVRASAGSLFRLNVVSATLADVLPKMRERGVRLVGTSSHKGRPLTQVDLTGPLALFIGSEGAGLPRGVLSEMDENVVIPHSDRVESLNAGVAASILLYEAARQRGTLNLETPEGEPEED
ncbi:MAG TPA: RNA methyltransferase [Terriglobales bacterium]|nr:RNA methyltransferase [Terriglobales bacterium]